MSNPLAILSQSSGKPVSESWVEATVTQVSPLKVHLITDDDPSDADPVVLDDPALAVGDRIWVQIKDRRLYVIGLITPRATSGTITTIPAFTWSQDFAPVYVASVSIPTPYTPPPGYGFEVFLLQANTFAWASTAGQNASTIAVRLQQTGNLSTTGITKLGWRLTRI